MSNGKVVDITRTDQAYWDALLKSENLGMNRGTTFPAEDILAKQDEKEAIQNESKNKGGRPRKPKPPKGIRPNLNRKERINAIRFTVLPNDTSGVFQLGGFRYHGSSIPFGAGRGRKGGGRGPDGSGAFIRYVGNAYDLARLEEKLLLEEGGRVHPSGHGPYKDF